MAVFLFSVSLQHWFRSYNISVSRLKYTRMCTQHFPPFIRMVLIVVIGRHMINL